MSDSHQRRKPGETAPTAPAPRSKVTIGLTASQAVHLRALWQEHSTALHAMLTGWCGDAQNASDILQEVFRRLAEAPANMDKMKNARAFLAVSARRIAVDFARRATTRSGYHSAAGAEAPAAENSGPTDEGMRLAIRTALESLPAEQRSVFNHKILSGRTLEEIARLEGISLNTAASRLRYALDKIRGQLRPYYDDLNRSQFKNMKNDLNQDLSENKRIITPLEPKRVPSVVPGLEGLAALSADSGVSDAPVPETAECYALPAVEGPAPEFVEPRVHIDPVFVEPPTGGIDPVPESFEEQAPEENGDGASSEIPELISCEMFPTDGEIPAEWLRPFELPEEFMVTVFESEGETGVVDGSEEVAVDPEGVPFDLESGFEICVLPVPEEFAVEMDPREYLVRYDAFLADNPDWGALDPDVMEAQVVTASKYFGELEFGTPGKAAAFDEWYATHFVGGGSSDGEVQDGGLESDPFQESAPFEPTELMPRYDAFLAENPTWVQENQGGDIQLQVITPSGYFPELEFGTPGEATAFDNWYTSWYATHHNPDGSSSGADDNGTLLVIGGPVDVPTEIHLPKEGVDGAGTLNGSGLVLDGRTGDFAGGTVVTGGRVVDGEIQPHWRSGGDASGPVYSLSGGGSGLVLGGGTLAAGGLSSGTVVTGGEVVTATERPADNGVAETGAGILSNPGLSLDGRTGDFPGQTVIAGGEVQIDPSLIWQFDPSRWEGTGFEARVAELMRAYDPTAQSASEEAEAPVAGIREASAVEDSESVAAIEPTAQSAESARAMVQASIVQAPAVPSVVLGLPVEIAAAEISGAESASGSGEFISLASTSQQTVSPESRVLSLDQSVAAQAGLAPYASAAAGGDFVADVAADASHDVFADAPVAQKHDSTTVAAGAVAVGGVAHGSGAAAAAARKPLPQI